MEEQENASKTVRNVSGAYIDPYVGHFTNHFSWYTSLKPVKMKVDT